VVEQRNRWKRVAEGLARPPVEGSMIEERRRHLRETRRETVAAQLSGCVRMTSFQRAMAPSLSAGLCGGDAFELAHARRVRGAGGGRE